MYTLTGHIHNVRMYHTRVLKVHSHVNVSRNFIAKIKKTCVGAYTCTL